uniref:Zinc transporter ZIP2-like n=1 Tax=Phallusia mammillata TaxID=59560 RepID=A0A6F9DS46_9ASCI|nr:zinc transporter ZIP2-like [Phallusia mammillata]
MDLASEKILLLVLLLLVGFGTGFTPFLLKNKCLSPSHFRDMLVSFLNCIAAGIFFATFFMHMLPEAQEQIVEQFGEDLEYPFAELIICFGFFFVLFLEQAVMSWFGSKSETNEASTTIENKQVLEYNREDKSILLQSREKSANYNTLRQSSEESTECTTTDKRAASPIVPPPAISYTTEKHDTMVRQSNSFTEVEISIATAHTEATLQEEQAHGHFDHEAHSSVRALVLLLALSAHALFEGLAIGFQRNASALRTLVIAVIIHKMTLAFSYGMSLVTNKASLRIVLMSMVIFSIMAPIGIGVGTGLSSYSDSVRVDKLIAVMQAFASGTFVYIIFVEIIPHEFNDETNNRISNTVCLLVGFAFMAALQALPHEEGED